MRWRRRPPAPAPAPQRDRPDLEEMAALLRDCYRADNHDSLDDRVAALMIQLSVEPATPDQATTMPKSRATSGKSNTLKSVIPDLFRHPLFRKPPGR